jgi:AcrR family transcriptional regulator
MTHSLERLGDVRPGGHTLRREVVVHHQRERILSAVIDLVGERGYRAVTVAAIVKAAGVSRLKFYEAFSSKQDAFLAALDVALAELAARVGEACDAAGERPADRMEAGVTVTLEFLAARPRLARAAVLEAPLLGPELGDRGAAALLAFAPLLAGARTNKATRALPESTEDSVLAGLYWLLYDALLSGEPDPIAELRPALIEFGLAPFLGQAKAHAAAAV